MWLERKSGGGEKLVTLEDAKRHVRVIGVEHDVEIDSAIAAASQYLDVDQDGFGGLGVPLLSQVWTVKGSAVTADLLRLPFGNVRSVDEIRYIGAAGEPGVVPADDYFLAKRGREWRVLLASGAAWPALANRPDAISIEFAAGWPNARAVPADIVSAAKVLIEFLFDGGNLFEVDAENAPAMRVVDDLTRRYRRFAL